MPYRRFTAIKLVLVRALLLAALPTACAIGVEPDFEELPLKQDAGGSGGTLSGLGGAGAGTASTASKAGATATSAGSSANPFGGSASSGGKAGAGSGAGGSSGSSGASSGGASSGGAAGASGSGGSGGGAGACSCPKTLPWTDNTVMSWKTGDCLTTGGATYSYIGTKPQTYANGSCNPAKQEAWCADMGNDYKFMACP